MPAPNPFVCDPIRNFTDTDWKQAVGSTDPGGGDNFSSDGGGEATLAGVRVPFNKLQAFYRYWLGYQACVAGGPSGGQATLCRTLPLKHPIWNELTADYAHAVAYSPDAQPSQTSPTIGLKRYVDTYVAIPTTPYFAGYNEARATIGFKDLPYDVIADNGITIYTQGQDTKFGTPPYQFKSEWQRFTEIDAAPKVEIINLQGFTVVYADGSGNNPPTTNPQGIKLPNPPTGQLIVKADLSLTTYKLPNAFLFAPGSLLPRNLLAALGKVNRYTLFNNPPGTLLFLGVELSKRRFSLRTSQETKYLWKMRCLFSFFDPPTGLNNNQTYSTTTFRGHNNSIWIGGRDASGNPLPGDKNSMKWFFCTASGNPTDPPGGVIPSFDLAQIWNPVSSDDGTIINPCYNTVQNPITGP